MLPPKHYCLRLSTVELPTSTFFHSHSIFTTMSDRNVRWPRRMSITGESR